MSRPSASSTRMASPPRTPSSLGISLGGISDDEEPDEGADEYVQLRKGVKIYFVDDMKQGNVTNVAPGPYIPAGSIGYNSGRNVKYKLDDGNEGEVTDIICFPEQNKCVGNTDSKSPNGLPKFNKSRVFMIQN
jgi:hypothetical protein